MLVLGAVVIPLLLPTSSYDNLEGKPGIIDHKYRSFPAYAIPIYVYGDLSCHQKSDHCFILNGNQMPFCIRELFLYSGLFIGLSFKRIWLKYLQRDWRRPKSWLFQNQLVLMGALGIFPMILDTLILPELILWQSSTASRIITGFIAGIGSAAIFIHILCHLEAIGNFLATLYNSLVKTCSH